MRWTLAPLLVLAGCFGSHGTDGSREVYCPGGGAGDVCSGTSAMPRAAGAVQEPGVPQPEPDITDSRNCDSSLTLFERSNDSWVEADRGTASFYTKECLSTEAATSDGQCMLVVDACWVDPHTLVVSTVCECGSGDQRNVIADWNEDTLLDSDSVSVDFAACGPWRVEYSRGIGCALSE